MLASNVTYESGHYKTPSTILFGQLRRWSIWLNRVSVLNQTRCTPLVYLYIELVYTRVIASGEARLISIYSYTHCHSLWDNGIYRPLLFVTRYLPFVAIPLFFNILYNLEIITLKNREGEVIKR